MIFQTITTTLISLHCSASVALIQPRRTHVRKLIFKIVPILVFNFHMPTLRMKLLSVAKTISLLFLSSVFILLLLEYFSFITTLSLEGVLQIDILNRKMLFKQLPHNIGNTELSLHVFNSQDLVNSLEIALKEKLRKNVLGEEFEIIMASAYLPDETKNVGADVMQARTNKLNETAIKINSGKVLHFAFVGDSRMRQLFAMFLMAIPDNDRLVFPQRFDVTAQVPIPHLVIAYSPLLRTVVSYNSRNLLRDNFDTDYVDVFKNWISTNVTNPKRKVKLPIPTPPPDYLLMGAFAHHMLGGNKHHEDIFLSELEELASVLKEMSNFCKIVWLNQYPTIEVFSGNKGHPTDVHAQKILQYNLRANDILSKSGIQIWNSASALVEEYIRSCKINKHHHDRGLFKKYFACRDYIHPGISALSDVIQILYNYWLPSQPPM